MIDVMMYGWLMYLFLDCFFQLNNIQDLHEDTVDLEDMDMELVVVVVEVAMVVEVDVVVI